MSNLVVHFIRKVKEVGLKITLIGLARRKKLKRVCRKYGIDLWHQSPYELRLYAQMAANSVNTLGCRCVVEVGCGLGEILKHIKSPLKYGYDINPKVIEAAKSIKPDRLDIKFEVGGLEDVAIDDTECLVAISWLHTMDDEYLRTAFSKAIKKNKFQYIVVDVKNSENQRKDFSKILPENYECISRKKYAAVESERWVEVWKGR